MRTIGATARAWGRLGLVSCFVTVSLVGGSGVATAEPSPITPVLECVVVDPSGDYTAVLGYDNPSGTPVTIPHGASNRISPSRYDGQQPTTFLAGRQRGVFSVTFSNGHPKWTLQGSSVTLTDETTTCPSPTEMPVEGNGMGLVIGVGVAGLLGVVMIRRLQRRLAAGIVPAAVGSIGLEADHA